MKGRFAWRSRSSSSPLPAIVTSGIGASAETLPGSPPAMAQAPVLACTVLAAIGERCERHEDRHQMPRLVKLAQGRGAERAKPILFDRVEADPPVLRSTPEHDLERHRLEQA